MRDVTILLFLFFQISFIIFIIFFYFLYVCLTAITEEAGFLVVIFLPTFTRAVNSDESMDILTD